MNHLDTALLAKLRSAFQVEAAEHLQAISSGLLELERAADGARRQEIVSAVFREAHSLKGAARAVNLHQIESICQSLESVFAAWRRHEVDPAPARFDSLHRAVTAIERLLPSSGVGQAALDTVDEMSDLLHQLSEIMPADPPYPDETRARPPAPDAARDPGRGTTPGEPGNVFPAERGGVRRQKTDACGPAVQAPPPARHPHSETLRISTAKLDDLLRRAEELLTVKLRADQRVAELRRVLDLLDAWEKEWTALSPEVRIVRQSSGDRPALFPAAPMTAVSTARPDPDPAPWAGAATRIAGFLDWNQSHIQSIRSRLAALAGWAKHDRRTVGGMVDALLEDTKKLMMLPCATLFEMFPRLVRDLSRDEGKDIELEVRGAEVEIDKRILGEMKDPLIHLLRNCVDHGIEPPEVRMKANKAPRGTITLAVSQAEGNKVEIVVSDDGAGIDHEKVRATAVRLGAISAAEAAALDRQDALGLIFQPEVSTNPIITEISGRGLGLSIVKEKVEQLGGRVVVDTTPDHGTSFRLLLPLTLATFRGILVQVADHTFVAPTAQVERVLQIARDEIRTVENRETICLSGRAVSLVRLAEALGISRPTDRADARFLPVVVLGAGDLIIAFEVDSVLEEQEVLVKPLGRPLVRVKNIAGATVLGSGKPIPILNVGDLMKTATVIAGRASSPAPQSSPRARERRALLVVDDSVTARMLLKNILESAGHRVRVAVDGVEAFTLLKTEPFDLVVSDVEMPRMNGFDLTAALRAEKKLAEIPVVLVTALASREDRERGVDVGANAYIVKSSFDQSNLLETIERLL